MIQTTIDVLSTALFGTDIQIDLRKYDQWVLWRGAGRLNETTGEVAGLTRVPYTIHLHKASTTNPHTWASFEQCVTALPVALEEWAAEEPSAYRGGGLGFVLTATDPYTGVDLDHCRNLETGALEPWAQQVVNALHSYTEVSPSRTGLRIFVQGRLSGKGQKRGPIELYDRERYLTVTGAHLPETPTTIENGQTMVEWLYVAMPIMATLLADSGRREKFQQLFAGDLVKATKADGTTFSSASEADLALCSLAGKAKASAEQIDALMRLSGLYRAKWDEMHGAQTYGQMTIAKALEGIGDASGAQRPATTLDVVCLDAVQPERVDWLWKPYLPLGKLALLEGDPGTGKSTLTAMLAAHVTRGRPFPGEADTGREPRNVLFLQCEDGLADTALPRFLAVGADKTRVYALTATVAIDDSRLGKAIAECRPALVVIDPLQGYLRAKLDMHRANQSRAAMDCLRRLAETHKCAILCVRHFAKTAQEKSLYRGLGSIDFAAVV